MPRLLLVEDHILVRQSIRAFLENAGFNVVGEAGTGREAVVLANSLQPDLIVMDVHLPEVNGIEATRHIHQQNPDIRVVALTAYNEKAYQRALIEAGADAFVLKTAEFSELLNVIHDVLAVGQLPQVVSEEDSASPLTDRELEVLACAGRGLTNKQIGVQLGISGRTAQVHLQAIYHKLGVTNRTEAVLRGLMLNLIPPIDGAKE